MRGRWRWLHRNTRGWQQNREQLCLEEGGGQSKPKSITHRVCASADRSAVARAPSRPSSFSAPRVLDPRACVNHETLVFHDTERMERRRIAFNDARFMLPFRENRSCYGLVAREGLSEPSASLGFVYRFFFSHCFDSIFFESSFDPSEFVNERFSLSLVEYWWYPSLLEDVVISRNCKVKNGIDKS